MLDFKIKPTIFVYSGNVNMCCSFDGLKNVVQDKLRRQPDEGELYVFFNKARTKIKVMFYDGNGFVIMYKALDTETFQLEYKNGMKKVVGVNPIKLIEDLNTDSYAKKYKNGKDT